MINWRAIPPSKWASYTVLAMVLADCVGIYVVKQRLSQPWVEPASTVSAQGAAADVVADAGQMRVDEPEVAPEVALAETSADSAQPSYLASSEEPVRTARHPDTFAQLPEYMPLPPAATEELPTFVPTIERSARRDEVRLPRMARLQTTRVPSRRFVSAFATDLVGSDAQYRALPAPAFGGPATETADSDPATVTGAGVAGAANPVSAFTAPEADLAEIPAPDFANSAAPAAPEAAAPAAIELPPVDTAAEAEYRPADGRLSLQACDEPPAGFQLYELTRQQRLHRGDRFGRLGAVRSAALRHVGPSAAALAAQRLDPGA